MVRSCCVTENRFEKQLANKTQTQVSAPDRRKWAGGHKFFSSGSRFLALGTDRGRDTFPTTRRDQTPNARVPLCRVE